MRRQSFSSDSSALEKGSVITLMIIGILALLMMIGLAIDAGNLYRSKLAMQNAVDSAVLASMNHVNAEGRYNLEDKLRPVGVPNWTLAQKTKAIEDYLKPRTLELIRANLNEAGLADAEVSFSQMKLNSAKYELGDKTNPALGTVHTYSVEASMPVNYLFLDLIPGFTAAPSVLTVDASAARNVANIAFLVDLSTSSGCPAGGACLCKTVAGGECDGAERIEFLLQALETSLRLFDLNRDRVIITVFNSGVVSLSIREIAAYMGASPDREIESSDIGMVVDYFRDVLTTSGVSNLSDALLTSYDKMQIMAPGQGVFYVALTEGAQSAGRGYFSTPKAGLPQWSKNNPTHKSPDLYDYSFYTTSWVDVNNISRPGVTKLYQSGMVPLEWDSTSLPVNESEKEIKSATVAPCNSSVESLAVNSDSDVEKVATEVFGSCLNDLSAHMPGDKERIIFPKTAGYSDWLKFPYCYLIGLSDYLREQKSTIFAVSYGDPDEEASEADPYNNITNFLSVKKNFLDRMAADLEQINDKVEFDCVGVAGHEELMTQATDNAGNHLYAPSMDEVGFMLNGVVKKVLARLTY